ncbi:hypothetical protein NGM10_02230 [Halorussus salilacus]|uniref:hypothetical protein n=1 Tax=Halorussus salilacus TaxID=2953750 RepID=UPI00209F49A4|nr:hypothetical protein [Halorussus salilacus]USZ68569.1 hypothetical protein NGM10_02230 [Halorussus salilacus]
MGKVSIGLRGWRFEEDEVFDDDGAFKPLDEIPDDPRKRLLRLQTLVGSPCDACWLIHGDENLRECNVSEVVYGEPLSEVTLCRDHETDFLYWFLEAGGDRYKGEDELQDAFHEWFLDGGRAPEGYGGIEHVETDPDDIPEPPEADPGAHDIERPDRERERIDLRNMEVTTVGGEDDESDGDGDDENGREELDLDDADLDLNQEYPS